MGGLLGIVDRVDRKSSSETVMGPKGGVDLRVHPSDVLILALEAPAIETPSFQSNLHVLQARVDAEMDDNVFVVRVSGLVCLYSVLDVL